MCLYLFCYDFLLSKPLIVHQHTIKMSLIFQIMLFIYACLFCCHFMLSKYRIFLQHTAKMAHPSADYVIYMYVYLFCYHFIISRCSIFCQHTTEMAHLSADYVNYLCVLVFFHLMLLRCRIFLQHTAKQIMLFIFVCICLFVIFCHLRVTSFVGTLPRYPIFQQVLPLPCVYLFLPFLPLTCHTEFLCRIWMIIRTSVSLLDKPHGCPF